jgi:hypothetical protein
VTNLGNAALSAAISATPNLLPTALRLSFTRSSGRWWWHSTGRPLFTRASWRALRRKSTRYLICRSRWQSGFQRTVHGILHTSLTSAIGKAAVEAIHQTTRPSERFWDLDARSRRAHSRFSPKSGSIFPENSGRLSEGFFHCPLPRPISGRLALSRAPKVLAPLLQKDSAAAIRLRAG